MGILCGKTDAGDWIAVHCSSSKNGVTVGEAYSARVESWKEDTTLSSELYDEVISDEVLGEAEPPKTLIDDSVVEPFVLAE